MILNNLKILRPYIFDDENENQVFFDEEMDNLFSVYEEKDEYDFIVETESEKYHYASECEDLIKSLYEGFEEYFAIGSYMKTKIMFALKEEKIELWEIEGNGKEAISIKILDITKSDKHLLEDIKKDFKMILDTDGIMKNGHKYLLNVGLKLLNDFEFKEIKRYKNDTPEKIKESIEKETNTLLDLDEDISFL